MGLDGTRSATTSMFAVRASRVRNRQRPGTKRCLPSTNSCICAGEEITRRFVCGRQSSAERRIDYYGQHGTDKRAQEMCASSMPVHGCERQIVLQPALSGRGRRSRDLLRLCPSGLLAFGLATSTAIWRSGALRCAPPRRKSDIAARFLTKRPLPAFEEASIPFTLTCVQPAGCRLPGFFFHPQKSVASSDSAFGSDPADDPNNYHNYNDGSE